MMIPVGLLYVQKRLPDFRPSAGAVVLDGIQFVQNGTLWLSSGVTGYLSHYEALFENHDEIVRLRKKTEKLRSLEIALTEIELENERLRQLIEFSSTFEGPRLIGAMVIGRAGSPFSKTIQIDKGIKDGVRRGDAVVSSRGAVGQVILAGRYASEVLLLTDVTSAVDVVVQRSRARGMMRGMSRSDRYMAKVNDFDRLHDVEEGDVVVTSGIGASFPEGVPIGEITAIRYQRDGLYIEADIKPFTSFDRMEDVLVLTGGSPERPWRRKNMLMELMETSLSPEAVKPQGQQ